MSFKDDNCLTATVLAISLQLVIPMKTCEINISASSPSPNPNDSAYLFLESHDSIFRLSTLRLKSLNSMTNCKINLSEPRPRILLSLQNQMSSVPVALLSA